MLQFRPSRLLLRTGAGLIIGKVRKGEKHENYFSPIRNPRLHARFIKRDNQIGVSSKTREKGPSIRDPPAGKSPVCCPFQLVNNSITQLGLEASLLALSHSLSRISLVDVFSPSPTFSSFNVTYFPISRRQIVLARSTRV